MTLDQGRSTGLSFRGATEQIQWDDDLVFKVAGKMFLVTSLEPGGGLSFKCEDETTSNLTELPGARTASEEDTEDPGGKCETEI
jgi:predicted DNA-binding protein (MmcQ/YjbR family)